MRDAITWWLETKSNLAALTDWLFDQYRGERTAAVRIAMLRDAFAAPGTRAFRVLSAIAEQEEAHAAWVGELLTARGLPLEVQPVAERYWPHVLEEIHDLESGAAVGAHAERMRLERIEAIANDPEAPADIRATFRRILPQERFHERAFRELAGEAAMNACQDAHERGRRALGLS